MSKRTRKRDGKLARWPADWPRGERPLVRDFPITTKELAAWLAAHPPRQLELFAEFRANDTNG